VVASMLSGSGACRGQFSTTSCQCSCCWHPEGSIAKQLYNEEVILLFNTTSYIWQQCTAHSGCHVCTLCRKREAQLETQISQKARSSAMWEQQLQLQPQDTEPIRPWATATLGYATLDEEVGLQCLRLAGHQLHLQA
jgi:hypothetical protein